jgi:pyridoxal phosphate enzyme (YggS family)
MDEQLLIDNITKLLKRVRRYAEKSQFGNSDILALAVSKTRSVDDIRIAHKCGLNAFGESYLQEAQQKIRSLQDLDLIWHFIGPIQSNKTRPIAEAFDWVHSVDRASIARRLNAQRPAHLPPLQVCVQVNISREASKSGANIEELPQLVRTVLDLDRLQLRGLMAIPAATGESKEQQKSFKQLREVFEGLKTLAPDMDTLSMGMSADMEAAISEGATIVRIGTTIFGPRNR